MKNLFLLLSLSVSAIGVHAQTPDWLWAKSAGGTFIDKSTGVSTDAGGNVLITGFFQSASITFGTTTLTNTGLNSADIFVVKYDASGNVLWAKSAGGPADDRGADISTDTDGNVLVTGFFQSGSVTFGTSVCTNAGGQDLFVVKYDQDGNVVWAKPAGGAMDDAGQGISTDASGQVLITGYFESPSLAFGTTALTNAATGFSDILTVKYDASGNVLWAKSAGGAYDDQGKDISTDAGGNILVTGSIHSPSAAFGTTTFSGTNFIAKYDASGNVLWTRSAAGNVRYAGIGTDAAGNALVTGWFGGSSVTFGTITLTNGGINSSDFFAAKYDGGGNVIWVKGGEGTQGSEAGAGISIDGNGNALITGYFQGPSIAFGAITVTNAGCENLFVVKYDASGNVLWAKSAGGDSCSDEGAGIATDANGNVLITGFFASASIPFGTNTVSNAGIYDLFVSKMDGSGATGAPDFTNYDAGITIAPNPFSKETTLQTDHILRNATLAVYNGQGQLVQKIQNIYGQTVALSCDNLPGGCYFVRLTEDNKFFAAGKFVITR